MRCCFSHCILSRLCNNVCHHVESALILDYHHCASSLPNHLITEVTQNYISVFFRGPWPLNWSNLGTDQEAPLIIQLALFSRIIPDCVTAKVYFFPQRVYCWALKWGKHDMLLLLSLNLAWIVALFRLSMQSQCSVIILVISTASRYTASDVRYDWGGDLCPQRSNSIRKWAIDPILLSMNIGTGVQRVSRPCVFLTLKQMLRFSVMFRVVTQTCLYTHACSVLKNVEEERTQLHVMERVGVSCS